MEFIVDTILSSALKRDRTVGDDHKTKESELHEMIHMFGFVSSDDGPKAPGTITASFTDVDQRIHGSIGRTETHVRRPDQATFSITLEAVGLDYARTLAVLDQVRRIPQVMMPSLRKTLESEGDQPVLDLADVPKPTRIKPADTSRRARRSVQYACW